MNRRGANMVILANFCHIGTPPMGSFFKLQQYIIPQKTTFFMNIHDLENENLVLSGKIEKSQFPYFELSHIGVLCTKTLTLNRNP